MVERDNINSEHKEHSSAMSKINGNVEDTSSKESKSVSIEKDERRINVEGKKREITRESLENEAREFREIKPKKQRGNWNWGTTAVKEESKEVLLIYRIYYIWILG